MSQLPIISGNKLLKFLISKQDYQIMGRKGSHVRLHDNDQHTAIVPVHHELRIGTLKSIINQMGMTQEEFIQEWNNK
ncbi:MAG: type II toxin-antitoxin system HicA family toxin [Nitrosopumilus sp.]|nr:type II toxin-antitoxin system HicA family toxin [Nitrosopumilus sp.]NRA05944.1 type II toxin-antitoxin system HicA family toxin [Nitrosopumilus sp.]